MEPRLGAEESANPGERQKPDPLVRCGEGDLGVPKDVVNLKEARK